MSNPVEKISGIAIRHDRADPPSRVAVLCPYCRSVHRHSLQDENLEHEFERVSHCIGIERRAYQIHVKKEMSNEHDAVAYLRRERAANRMKGAA